MSEERIQKLLARAGVAARRKVEELLAAGLVTVNGRVAALGDKADPEHDAIKVEGRRVDLRPAVHRYLLLNKPLKVMSTVEDPEGRPTVMDLVPPQFRKALVPVGRLDFLTEGLLLLTDDGELAHRVGHPRFGCTKLYEVKVKGVPSADAMRKLRQGTVIEGKRTVPREVTSIRKPGPRDVKNSWWRVELGEGRNREIREMFFRVGHPVAKLRRVAIGPITDAGLPVGAVRELTEAEVAALRRATSRVRKPVLQETASPGRSGTASPGSPPSRAGRGSTGAGRAKTAGSWLDERRSPESAGTSGRRSPERGASTSRLDERRSEDRPAPGGGRSRPRNSKPGAPGSAGSRGGGSRRSSGASSSRPRGRRRP